MAPHYRTRCKTARTMFSSNLKSARLSAGLTIDALAANVAISPAVLAGYESAARFPNGVTFARLVRAFPGHDLLAGVDLTLARSRGKPHPKRYTNRWHLKECSASRFHVARILSGQTLRQLASTLNLSHQRVHQLEAYHVSASDDAIGKWAAATGVSTAFLRGDSPHPYHQGGVPNSLAPPHVPEGRFSQAEVSTPVPDAGLAAAAASPTPYYMCRPRVPEGRFSQAGVSTPDPEAAAAVPHAGLPAEARPHRAKAGDR